MCTFTWVHTKAKGGVGWYGSGVTYVLSHLIFGGGREEQDVSLNQKKSSV